MAGCGKLVVVTPGGNMIVKPLGPVELVALLFDLQVDEKGQTTCPSCRCCCITNYYLVSGPPR